MFYSQKEKKKLLIRNLWYVWLYSDTRFILRACEDRENLFSVVHSVTGSVIRRDSFVLHFAGYVTVIWYPTQRIVWVVLWNKPQLSCLVLLQ